MADKKTTEEVIVVDIAEVTDNDAKLGSVWKRMLTFIYRLFDTADHALATVHRSAVLMDDVNKTWSYKESEAYKSKLEELLK